MLKHRLAALVLTVGSLAPLTAVASSQGLPGDLFVTGGSEATVLEINPTSGASSTFISAGTITSGAGIAFGADGNLYVTDYNGAKLDRFNGTSGAFIGSSSWHGSDSYGLADGAGKLYQTNGSAGAASGIYISTAAEGGTIGGSYTSSPSQNDPWLYGDTVGPDGQLYVTNAYNGEVYRYSTLTGASSTFVSAGGPITSAADVAFDSHGNLWVSGSSSGGNGHIDEYSSMGVLLEDYTPSSLNDPLGIAFDTNGNLWVANLEGDNLTEYGVSGSGLALEQTVSTPNFDPLFIAVKATPEPTSLSLLGLAVVGFTSRRPRSARDRRRNKI